MINDTIVLTPISKSDLNYLYELQCIEGIRAFALNADTPNYDEHVEWFNNKLTDSKTDIFKVIDDEHTIGVVRVDRQSENSNNIAEISLTIDPKYAGKGYAKRSINKIIADTNINTYHAVIHEKNIASQKVFITNGFKYDSSYCPDFNLYIYHKG